MACRRDRSAAFAAPIIVTIASAPMPARTTRFIIIETP
jgi:hypothetical protein